MSSIALLVDNDVVIKLCQMDAYDDTLAALKTRADQIGSLGVMLRFMGKTSEEKRLRLMKNRVAADRFSAVLHKIVEIEPTEEEQEFSATLMKAIILANLDVDEGEVALIAIAVHRERPDLLTADKKALRSLPELQKLDGRIDRLKGRILCFEQVIKLLCKAFGLQRIRKAVNAAPYADSAITQAYSTFSDQGPFIAALDLVVKDRIVITAPGWLKPV